MSDWNLVADLGGTKMSAALVDANGQVVHRKTVPTQANDGFLQLPNASPDCCVSWHMRARFSGLGPVVLPRLD